MPPALGFYWHVGQRTQALLTWDREWWLGQLISLGRGGGERTSARSVVLYTVDAFLSEPVRSISHPFQTGRVFLPLVPNDIDTEANYMSDRILKLSSPVQLFPISTDPQKCVFISAEQKKLSIYFCSGIPLLLHHLYFFRRTIKSFWQRNRWTSIEAQSLFFPSFQTSTAAACRAFSE